jgi:hypothetical protein
MTPTIGYIHLIHIDPAGKPTRVVTGVDGDAFSQLWLETVAGHV